MPLQIKIQLYMSSVRRQGMKLLCSDTGRGAKTWTQHRPHVRHLNAYQMGPVVSASLSSWSMRHGGRANSDLEGNLRSTYYVPGTLPHSQ